MASPVIGRINMKALLKKVARKLLPRWLRPARKSSVAASVPNFRQDLVHFPVEENVSLAVFWKVMDIGRGPALSVYVFDCEVLKFDCYGVGQGHYHVSLQGENEAREHRLLLPEKTAEEQIERTLFELTHNLSYYLQRNADPRIRQTRVASANLEPVIHKVRAKLIDYLQRSMNFSGAHSAVAARSES